MSWKDWFSKIVTTVPTEDGPTDILHSEELGVECEYGGETMTELNEERPAPVEETVKEPEDQFPEEHVGEEVESEVDLNPEDFEEVDEEE